jgi:hypothetical protein
MRFPRHLDGGERVESITVTDGEHPVTAVKLVSLGELLLLEGETDQVRLDAMLLEGLSWQRDGADLAELVADPDVVLDDPGSSYDGGPAETAEAFTIANEYTTVEVGVVETGGADALQISSEKGVSVLGPATLGALTTIEDTVALSRWFRTPIGPEQPL